eukprot:TRINITY_DN5656_c0_g1_i1.p1 TRINITY_DN5656_c0_g1~~TRINITY_DN5656_c0_g1_i1.p1  ORF type:complete len:548 (+),score=104.98 TRINITY_DN5656_c0_g1_i1:135-1778(+)
MKKEGGVGIKALASANAEVICTAKKESVRKATMREVLSTTRLRIPMFQRRYCWGPAQWNLLLTDALAETGHELGRLTLYEVPNGDVKDGRTEAMVSDGQQRCTTSLLLLAAIRDATLDLGILDAEEFAMHLNSILCPDQAGFKRWAAAQAHSMTARTTSAETAAGAVRTTATLVPATATVTSTAIATASATTATETKAPVEHDTDLAFMALSPTYFDREAFFTALLPPSTVCSWTQMCEASYFSDRPVDSSPRPLEAKRHFRVELSKRLELEKVSKQDALTRLRGAAEGVLSFRLLYFAMSLSGNKTDGTEDVTVIFLRMAWRDEMLRRLMSARPDEGVNLGDGDFIRTLLLGSFRREEDAIAMYRKCWLVVEAKAEELSRASQGVKDTSKCLESLLKHFLAAHPPANAKMSRQVFGPSQTSGFFAAFQEWLRATLTADTQDNDRAAEETMLADVEIMEKGTQMVLEKMSNFAKDYVPPPPNSEEALTKSSASEASMCPPPKIRKDAKRSLGAWKPCLDAPTIKESGYEVNSFANLGTSMSTVFHRS